MTKQMREDLDPWCLPSLMILCWQTLLVITKHPEDGPGSAQMDNTTAMLIIFYWGSASDQEWTVSEHKVFQEQTLEVTTTCRWWPSNFVSKESASQNTRLKFDVEKLKYPNVLETFQAMIGGRFAPLTILNDEDADIELMVTTFKAAVTETASEILYKHHKKKKPGSWQKFLICVTKRESWERENVNVKDQRNTGKWTSTSRGAWKRQKKTGQENSVVRLKKIWGGTTARGHISLWKTWPLWNSWKLLFMYSPSLLRKMPCRRVRDTELMDRILLWGVESQGQWSSVSTELSPDRHRGWPPHLLQRSGGCSIIIEEREVSLSCNISAEMVQAGGEEVIIALTTICNKIWPTGEWPILWAQSLVITLTKKGNLQQCQKYWKIRPISRPSKVILNRLKLQVEKIIAEEQAGFRAERSTTE